MDESNVEVLPVPFEPPLDVIEAESFSTSLATKPELPPFKWTTERRRAAALVAAGDLTLKEVAEQVGYGYRHLKTWNANLAFKARVRELQEEANERLATYTVARKQKRLELIEDLLQDALEFRQSRGKHMSAHSRMKRGEQPIPGAETGMIGMRYKIIRRGSDTDLIEEYYWDADLEQAFMRLLKEGKQEQGGTVDSDSGIKRLYIGVDISAV